MRPHLQSRHRQQARAQIFGAFTAMEEEQDRERQAAARAAARAERVKWEGLPPIDRPFGVRAYEQHVATTKPARGTTNVIRFVMKRGRARDVRPALCVELPVPRAEPVRSEDIMRMHLGAALLRFAQARRLKDPEAREEARKRAERSAERAIALC